MALGSSFVLLRFHFSYFLLPIMLLPIALSSNLKSLETWLLLAIVHLLVYPSSNGYNSYCDKDEGPIGGLKNPPKPSRSLYWICLVFDALSLVLAIFISVWAVIGLSLYILASRLYSHPKTRLKKRPIVSLLLVSLGQGGIVYLMTALSLSIGGFTSSQALVDLLLGALCTALFLAGVYPLGQIYQHKEDEAHGDLSYSRLLGIKGTFISSLLFLGLGIGGLGFFFYLKNGFNTILVFGGFLAPALLFFLWWMYSSFKDQTKANFTNMGIMNVLSSTGMNSFLILKIVGVI